MPLMPWTTHVLQWPETNGRDPAEGELTPKPGPSPGLQAATLLHEVLGIASNCWSASDGGEFALGLVHTASPHYGSWPCLEVITLTARRGMSAVASD
ncbi:hypothetical protein H5410_064462 [Solanum commersonii]|uniref:Uncharacterized protein n=1 Tax=Solanum commersonii TaxID=4109 RepID=A0A9J5VZC6_SOLCO|nr:hypothetical protein H5410_064462 [Solanum commersonii]